MRAAPCAILAVAGLLTVAGCDRISVPQSPLLKYTERKSGLIAVTNENGDVVVMDQGAAAVTPLTTGSSVPDPEQPNTAFSYYLTPVWSPDGERIAAVHYAGRDGQVVEARIDLIPATPGDIATAYTSTTQAPTLVAWSPDSRRLVFLAMSESGASFAFYRVAADGGPVTLLDAGVPYGWAWSPRSQELVIHAGSVSGGLAAHRLAFLDVEEVLEEGLGLPSGLFGSPAWSSDGRKIVVATLTQDRNRIYVTNRALTEGAVLAEVEGQLEFTLSPRDDKVAYLLQEEDGSRLYVLDVPARLGSRAQEAEYTEPGTSPGRLLSGQDVVAAFFWSPDGKRIAYFVPNLVSMGEGDEAQQALVLTLKFADVGRATARESATFFPSSSFLAMIQAFGQYAHVARIWSPDSRNLVYTALDQEGPAVMVALAAESIAPRRIAAGHAATWSRR